jgi:hypothetical protein
MSDTVELRGVAGPSRSDGSNRALGHLDRVIDVLDPIDDFNFRHFRMRHMVAELLRPGLAPGTEAPGFDLSSTDGTRVRLTDLRGRPVLLHFVSYTCPVTRGGVDTMRELHGRYSDRVRFLEVVVRQAHPGERHGAYRLYEDKLRDARAYVAEEGVPWPVLTDDLVGTVQRAYGGLAAAVYLIDSRGIVVFCGTWGQAPALRAAIDELLARGGAGSRAGKGTDRRPHLAGAIVAGQRGPLRGGWQSLVDLELGFPGGNLLMLLGRVARPLLSPLALRTTPLPAKTRVFLATGLVGVGLAIGSSLLRRRGGFVFGRSSFSTRYGNSASVGEGRTARHPGVRARLLPTSRSGPSTSKEES